VSLNQLFNYELIYTTSQIFVAANSLKSRLASEVYNEATGLCIRIKISHSGSLLLILFNFVNTQQYYIRILAYYDKHINISNCINCFRIEYIFLFFIIRRHRLIIIIKNNNTNKIHITIIVARTLLLLLLLS